MKPDEAAAHVSLGATLARCGRLDEAIAHFQRALQLRPNDAAAHVSLATALVHRGRLDEAIAHYQTALAFAQRQHNAAVVEALQARLGL